MAKRVSLKGKGADLFFGDYTPGQPAREEPQAVTYEPAAITVATPTPESPKTPDDELAAPASVAAAEPRRARARRATNNPPDRALVSEHASTIASKEDLHDTLIEAIRKVVKNPGREVSFVRLSQEEKAALTDVIYTYKRLGIKTTENEINRIAINILLNDFHAHGEQSTLARVLAALRA